MKGKVDPVIVRTLKRDSGCEVAGLVALLSGRWVLPVLFELHSAPNPVRFSELAQRLDGIMTSELSRALKRLEAMHLVRRHSHNTMPPKVDYECTSLGHSLRPQLDSLAEWLNRNRSELIRGPRDES